LYTKKVTERSHIFHPKLLAETLKQLLNERLIISCDQHVINVEEKEDNAFIFLIHKQRNITAVAEKTKLNQKRTELKRVVKWNFTSEEKISAGCK